MATRTHEWRRALILAAGAVLVCLACDRTAEQEAVRSAPTHVASTVPSAATPKVGLVGIHRITGNARPSDRLPLVIALHGLGDRPESFSALFSGFEQPARFVMLRAPTSYAGGYSWFPFRDGASDAERAAALRKPAALVAEEIRALAARHPTRGRPIVTGFSQGGMLSFAIAAQHADVIGAAFPVGGLLPAALLPSSRPSKSPPRVVALHGAMDVRVPTKAGARAVAGMKTLGYDAQFEAFPGVGHNISAAMRQRLHALIKTEIARAD